MATAYDQPYYMDHPTSSSTDIAQTLIKVLNDALGNSGTSVTGSTGAGATGTTSAKGFASQYAPGALGSIYDNPQSILPDVYKGLDWASPLAQTLSGMKADPLALYNLLVGSQTSFKDQSDAQGDEAFVNWLAEMYKGLGTAGGKGFNISNLLGGLFSQDTSKDEPTALNSILRSGDTNQQANFLYSLVRDATNVGMNPMAAAGYQSATARSMDQWRNDTLKGDTGQNLTALEWIKKNNPGLVIG